jgi:HEXXH motif-containing protein
VNDAVTLLAAAGRRSRPELDAVLLHPMVGAWAAHCLRNLNQPDGCDGVTSYWSDTAEAPDTSDPDTVERDLGHFGGIAVSAALRAGIDVDLAVRTSPGQLFLPTLGHVRLGDSTTWCHVRASGGKVEVTATNSSNVARFDLNQPAAARAASAETAAAPVGWFPQRTLSAHADGRRLALAVEDTDPFRDYGTLDVADTLDDGALARWQAALAAAWRILVRHHLDRAVPLAANTTSFVPLNPSGVEPTRFATYAEAFGAMSLSLPPSPVTLAAAIVHEFQHNKLYALMHLIPLIEVDDQRFYAPWRPDPRPATGLLQGAYAHLALVDFWYREQSAATNPAERQAATFEFLLSRSGLACALDTLADSGSLTPAGARFVAGMKAEIERWASIFIDDLSVVAAAEHAAAEHRAAWLQSHARGGSERPAGVGP